MKTTNTLNLLHGLRRRTIKNNKQALALAQLLVGKRDDWHQIKKHINQTYGHYGVLGIITSLMREAGKSRIPHSLFSHHQPKNKETYYDR